MSPKGAAQSRGLTVRSRFCRPVSLGTTGAKWWEAVIRIAEDEFPVRGARTVQNPSGRSGIIKPSASADGPSCSWGRSQPIRDVCGPSKTNAGSIHSGITVVRDGVSGAFMGVGDAGRIR